MAEINVLPTQFANLIAAGEVVERPASAVKELIENSIDAESRHITVEVNNGGITFIRVTDDGKGIAPEDVETAFLRHATSKIEDPEDLNHIQTMGFRGEALAALSAVSKIDMFTRRAGRKMGRHITIEGGEIKAHAEAGCGVGTTIIVRDLFYNVPARSKFMKKDSTEAARIEEAVINAALSNPQIAINLIKDGKDVFASNGKGKLKDVLYTIVGKDTMDEMLSFSTDRDGIDVYGYMSSLSVTRANRNMQQFFVNGRPVKSRIMSVAVDEAYKGRITIGKYPLVFIFLRINPELIDVNVHPAKTEIKFLRERDVFSLVREAVVSSLDAVDIPAAKLFYKKEREKALANQPLFPPLSVSAKGYTYPSAYTKESLVTDKSDYKLTYAEIAAKRKEEEKHTASTPDTPPRYVYPKFEKKSYAEPALEKPVSWERPVPEEPCRQEEIFPQETPSDENIKIIGELFHTYILAERNGRVWIIDKHAAHERSIYNKLQTSNMEEMVQYLIVPASVTMPRMEKNILLENAELIEKIGMELSDIGGLSLIVRSAPSYISEEEIPALLCEMAQKLLDNRIPKPDKLDAIMKSVSCKSAIKAGMKNDPREYLSLVKEVLSEQDMRSCPHGRPCVFELTREELEKMFKRIV